MYDTKLFIQIEAIKPLKVIKVWIVEKYFIAVWEAAGNCNYDKNTIAKYRQRKKEVVFGCNLQCVDIYANYS